MLIDFVREYCLTHKPIKYLSEEVRETHIANVAYSFLKKSLLKAKINNEVTVHILRYLYPTHLIQPGIHIIVVQDLLDQENIITAMTYTNIMDIDKKKTLDPPDFYNFQAKYDRKPS